MEILSWLFNFVHAHPYLTAFIAFGVFCLIVVALAESSSGGGYSGGGGGGSLSSYTSSISQAGDSAKEQMHSRSDAYLRDVRDTTRRNS